MTDRYPTLMFIFIGWKKIRFRKYKFPLDRIFLLLVNSLTVSMTYILSYFFQLSLQINFLYLLNI